MEFNIFKEMSAESDASFKMTINDTGAYSRLVDAGIVILGRERALFKDNLQYQITRFGRAVMNSSFSKENT